ncbi:unnamed protein product, partial [Mycena citricolor]
MHCTTPKCLDQGRPAESVFEQMAVHRRAPHIRDWWWWLSVVRTDRPCRTFKRTYCTYGAVLQFRAQVQPSLVPLIRTS